MLMWTLPIYLMQYIENHLVKLIYDTWTKFSYQNKQEELSEDPKYYSTLNAKSITKPWQNANKQYTLDNLFLMILNTPGD